MRSQFLGFRHSEGDVDGNKYNFITCYAIAKLQTRDNQKGRAGIEIRADLDLKKRFSELDFNQDLQVEFTIEKVATGKGLTADLITDFKVLPPNKII